MNAVTFISTQCYYRLFLLLQSEQFYDAIIASNWYLLEPRHQRMFMILIQNCQEPRTLSIGGFKELNMITCVSVRNNQNLHLMHMTSILIFAVIQNDLFIRNLCLRFRGTLKLHQMNHRWIYIYLHRSFHFCDAFNCVSDFSLRKYRRCAPM